MSAKTLVVLIAVAFAACNSLPTNANNTAHTANTANTASTPSTPTPQTFHTADGVRRVTTAELEDLMKQGKVVVVDVRNKEAYDLGHIPGAKLIPVNQVGERYKELPRDKTIVTYCS